MTAQKHFVIFSHGFGVRKDSRGLFSDIVAVLKDIEPVLFDYNAVNEVNNTITIRPLHVQTDILKNKIQEIRTSCPEAVIDIVCHSQGAIIAGLVKPSGIRKIILLAPPTEININWTLARFSSRSGFELNKNGISKIARQDGSTTLVPSEYWDEVEKICPIDLYNDFASQTELIIINAAEDKILRNTDFSKLSPKAKVMSLHGSHNFTGEVRSALVDEVQFQLSI